MYISWGQLLTFYAIRTTSYTDDVVYTEDQTTYLWNHKTWRGMCLLNTNLNAFKATGENVGFTDNIPPAVSLANIMPILLTPRQKLVMWQQDNPNDPATKNIILQSPLATVRDGKIPTSDANNGPWCTYWGTDTSQGNSSIILDLEFTTDINQCSGSQSPVILSNRYSMRILYDADNFCPAYEYTGMAILRTDILNASYTPNTPDLFRQALLPAVQNGYQRKPMIFELNERNSSLRYSVIDKYQPKSQPNNQYAGIAQLIVNELRGYTVPLGVGAIIPDRLPTAFEWNPAQSDWVKRNLPSWMTKKLW